MNRYTNSFIFKEHSYYYCDLKKVFERYPILRKLPNSLKILLESNIRNVQEEEIIATIATFVHKNHMKQIEFYPNRIIMQDVTGIPVMVELASIRDEVSKLGGKVESINPQIMVDLVIDDSLNTDVNIQKEQVRNKERYEFIKWAQNQFKNFSVIPPHHSMSHQVNLEYLSTMLGSKIEDNKILLYPEIIVGTDHQTTMINALGVFGYKVGSIEVQAAMLGSSISLNLPRVIGVDIFGTLAQGVSIRDVIYSLKNILIEYNIEGSIVEFYGSGLKNIPLSDRATLSTVVEEDGAICGYFGVDNSTIAYVEQTRGVDASLIKEYFTKQGMFDNHDLTYDEYVKFDLSAVRPIVAGPKRAESTVSVKEISTKLESFKKGIFVNDNDIVLATIILCTSSSNKSNLTLLIQAGLLAKRACELGLTINKNIKGILSSDSHVVKEYLEKLDLLKYIEKLGFVYMPNSVNERDLVEKVSMDIDRFNLDVVSLISEARSFEKRTHPQVKSNWLMSPALVIAYCLKGNINFNITKNSIFQDIYLSDIWPSTNEVNEYLGKIDSSIYQTVYKDIFLGNKEWQELKYEDTPTYNWNDKSTYIQASNLFENVSLEKIEIKDAKILAILGDNITTEHLSPIGQIVPYTPAALYLESKGLHPDEFNTFGNRRGNAELMVRGTLSNIKLKNKMVSPKEGGFTKDFSTGEIMPIYDFSVKMKEQDIPLVIFAGSEYGIGNPRDWAVKGIKLLGVKAVIAKSFDKTHRSNLVSMGILPLEFIDDDIENLNLKGNEIITIKTNDIKVNVKIEIEIKKDDEVRTIVVQSRLDTKAEVSYYKNGGILPYLSNRHGI